MRLRPNYKQGSNRILTFVKLEACLLLVTVGRPFSSHHTALAITPPPILAGCLTVAEISEHLGLDAIKNRQWSIQKTSAVSGEGLYEGLEWYASGRSLRGW